MATYEGGSAGYKGAVEKDYYSGNNTGPGFYAPDSSSSPLLDELSGGGNNSTATNPMDNSGFSNLGNDQPSSNLGEGDTGFANDVSPSPSPSPSPTPTPPVGNNAGLTGYPLSGTGTGSGGFGGSGNPNRGKPRTFSNPYSGNGSGGFGGPGTPPPTDRQHNDFTERERARRDQERRHNTEINANIDKDKNYERNLIQRNNEQLGGASNTGSQQQYMDQFNSGNSSIINEALTGMLTGGLGRFGRNMGNTNPFGTQTRFMDPNRTRLYPSKPVPHPLAPRGPNTPYTGPPSPIPREKYPDGDFFNPSDKLPNNPLR